MTGRPIGDDGKPLSLLWSTTGQVRWKETTRYNAIEGRFEREPDKLQQLWVRCGGTGEWRWFDVPIVHADVSDKPVDKRKDKTK